MEGLGSDHSDSDSGDSWTILEHTPLHGDEAPQTENNLQTQEGVVIITDKDEDTDGISIISDSEPESISPCDISYDKYLAKKGVPMKEDFSYPVADTPTGFNNDECFETKDDFLGVDTVKHKTYVHRRNKRLSTVLNIIVLGSVITAAGVAIGHMWGVKDDCAIHTTPSVNKILSNLYKLQEENTFLRNKLKELTLYNNVHNIQRKTEAEKLTQKHKSKKESIGSLRTETDEFKYANSNLLDNKSGKDFLSEIDKLKITYKQNKDWLDDEITKRLTTEYEALKRLKRSQKFVKEKNEIQTKKGENLKRELEVDSEEFEQVISEAPAIERKVTYADSLKSDHGTVKNFKPNKSEINEKSLKDHSRKKKSKGEHDTISELPLSDEEPKKDNRYVGNKIKMEVKKNDRQKHHKKQKRRNKYEQWEMKSGYMKDLDDYSLNSFQDNEYPLKSSDKNQQSRDFERKNYIDQFTKTEETKMKPIAAGENLGKDNVGNWFDKRAALRQEARKKLESEMFGPLSSQNTAGWYFRRMQRREQCRAKGDNSTYRKLSKRNMNFKTKH